MPIYSWRCKKCDKLTDILKPFDDSGVPPDKCEHCDNEDQKEFVKKIGKNITVVANCKWSGKGNWALPFLIGVGNVDWIAISNSIC